MKTILNIITFLLLSLIGYGQTLPMTENFNSFNGVGEWTTCCGAGVQNYGGAENYATFNIGNTPYPHNSTITITSPTYNFTSLCSTSLKVSFPLKGLIEPSADYMYFQYWNGTSWVTQATFTGVISLTTYNYTIPTTATQFRFILVTDCSVNGYKGGGTLCSFAGYPTTCTPAAGNCSGALSVFYYDITYFKIECNTPLPIELVEFKGSAYPEYNLLEWLTATEINNDYFIIERSENGVEFYELIKMDGAGNSTMLTRYSTLDNKPLTGINYYRLKQFDFDGKVSTSKIIAVSRENENEILKVIKITNVLGQEVSDDTDGVKIYFFSNGTVLKKYDMKER
jgi:hypothetical protein